MYPARYIDIILGTIVSIKVPMYSSTYVGSHLDTYMHIQVPHVYPGTQTFIPYLSSHTLHFAQ